MSIINKKKEIFGKIAATRTLTSGLPKLKLSSSLPSINNNGDSITFLSDLIKSLIGYEALVDSVVDILTNSIPKIELAIRNSLKKEMKSIVSCGIDPHLPDWIKSNGNGIVIEVKKIDFFDILRTNPSSTGGKLIYNDITTPETDSTDFNTFLYGVLQNDGTTYTWSQNGKNLFNITFNSMGDSTRPNNTLKITAHPDYDNKTLTELIGDFIDTIDLFNTENVLNQIMDVIYGTISSEIGKSIKQLETEAEINSIIDKMINNVNKFSIDDAAFSFTNPEINLQQLESDKRKLGLSTIQINTTLPSSVPISSLTDFTQQILSANTVTQKKDVITNSLNNMANLSADRVNDLTDVVSTKLNFIQQIINNLIKSIINIILGPKVMFSFLIIYQIVYESIQDTSFTDPIDFIKKNKTLMNELMKTMSEEIIKILISIALKEISSLVTEAAISKQKEKAMLKLAQLQSLIGVPSSTLKNITDNL